MTATNEQSLSHADSHDLDKLARWKAGLDTAGASGDSTFPACAIFLVTGEDRASHDIFRRYRSAFEDLGGGFHHLVIFGQHGVSTTQQAFVEQVGRGQESVPMLLVVPMDAGTSTVYAIELPKGDRDGELDETQTWGAALAAVRAAASTGAPISLDGIDGISARVLPGGSLTGTVDRALADLSR